MGLKAIAKDRDGLAGEWEGWGTNSAPLRPGSGPERGPDPKQCENTPEPKPVPEPALQLGPGPGQVFVADQCHSIAANQCQPSAAGGGDAEINGQVHAT